jgi:hypothetical protein
MTAQVLIQDESAENECLLATELCGGRPTTAFIARTAQEFHGFSAIHDCGEPAGAIAARAARIGPYASLA